MTSISTIRRQNVLTLFQLFAEGRISAGEQPKGLDGSFAEHLGISSATWSMAKSGKRPIGDKMARQIEHHCEKPPGWLDHEREPQGMTEAEKQFLALALRIYRQTNSAGRRELRQMLRDWCTRCD